MRERPHQDWEHGEAPPPLWVRLLAYAAVIAMALTVATPLLIAVWSRVRG